MTAEKVDLIGTPLRRINEAGSIVLHSAKPLAETVGDMGIVFLRHPRGPLRRTRQVILGIIDEMTQDGKKEKI